MDIQTKYETGLPTFKKLFVMSCEELRETIFEICGSQIPNESLLSEGTIKKTSSNDEPEKIEIYYYDSISITPFGIDYKPEHGTLRMITEFNKFFKL